MQPDVKLIAFDTSAAHCAAALLLGARIVTRVDEMAKGQAEHLLPMLNEMLAAENLHWSDLDAVAVNVGPGNFTGIRIAVSAARGLALAMGKPAIGVNGFETRAFGVLLPFTAIIPGPRKQVYTQRFAMDGTASAPAIVPQDEPLSLPCASDLMIAVAKIAADRIGQPAPRPTPFYVRPADAAPPKDQGPIILP